MMTAGKPDVRVKLILGDTAGTLTFFDPESTAAVEVRPMLAPGVDPQTGPPKTAVAALCHGRADRLDGGDGRARAMPEPWQRPASRRCSPSAESSRLRRE